MGPKDGRNLNRVNYFSIKEYTNNITYEPNTLDHMEYVNKLFDEYLEALMNYDELAITLFLCSSFEKEIKYSNIIENHIVHPLEINSHNMFFDKLSINHTRIKELHKFVLKRDNLSDYRTTEMPIGTYRETSDDSIKTIEIDGKKYYEDIYWYGAEAKDIKRFMDDFIKFYKDNSFSVTHSNPFIKSALVQLLFLRIHPFEDGNGRTARMLHNMKFTDSINRIKGSNLKISPLNISPGIYNYKNDYNKCIDNIFFDLDHFDWKTSNNPEFNRWFNFMLTTTEEEINFLKEELVNRKDALENIHDLNQNNSPFTEEIRKMKMKVLAPKQY